MNPHKLLRSQRGRLYFLKERKHAMRDLHNHLNPIVAIAPVSVADNTAQVSGWIDRKGYQALEFAIALGAMADADATFAVTVEHADAANQSDAVAVPADRLLGTLADAGFTAADDNKSRKLGYVGERRYVRLTITPSSNASAALLCVVAILGHASISPAAIPS